MYVMKTKAVRERVFLRNPVGLGTFGKYRGNRFY
jgi:hypothetical protein